jgi:hypothetical protein
VRLRRDSRGEVEKALAWERDELRGAAERARKLVQSAAIDVGRRGRGGVLSEPVLVLVGWHAHRALGLHDGDGLLVALATRHNRTLRVMARTGRLLDDRGEQLSGSELFSVRLGARWGALLFVLQGPDGREMGVARRRGERGKPRVERAYAKRYRRSPVFTGSVRMGTVAMPVDPLGFCHPMRDWYVEEDLGRPVARIICADQRNSERVGYMADFNDGATTLQHAIAIATMLAAEARRIVPVH